MRILQNTLSTLIVVAFILVSINDANASRARMTALGQDTSGSYYVEDVRNIFLNPAEILEYPDQVTFEWGDNDRPAATGNTTGEGGFVYSLLGGKLGFHLGRQPYLTTVVTLLNSGGVLQDSTAIFGATLPEAQDVIDIIYGRQSGDYKWGVGVMYSNAKGNQNRTGGQDLNDKATSLELRGGLNFWRMTFNTRINLFNRSENQVAANNTVKYDSDFGILLGSTYMLNNRHRIFAEFTLDESTLDGTTNVASYDGSFYSARLGLAGARKIAKYATNFIYAAEFAFLKLDYKTRRNTVPEEKFTFFGLPLTIGLEGEATDWMKLRGSITQRIQFDTNKTSFGVNATNRHIPSTTVVGAGASFLFKRFTLDATFAGASGSGSLSANNFLADLALNYVF